MSKDDCERLLLTLYSENGESIDDFYKRNELEIASNVTDEEAEVISAFHLMQKLDKNLLRIMFPQFNERRIENMRMRGLFDISSEHVASYYSLFGKGSQGDWSLGLSDIVKAFISLIESGSTQFPRLDTAAKLARALGCTIDELLGEKKEETPCR